MSETEPSTKDQTAEQRLEPAEAARRLGVDYDEFLAAERLLAFGLSSEKAIPDRLIADFAIVRARIDQVAAGGSVAEADDAAALEADLHQLSDVLRGAPDAAPDAAKAAPNAAAAPKAPEDGPS